MRNILMNLSGHEIDSDLNDDQQLVQTYTEILKIFDEIHFLCRSTKTKSSTIRHASKPIFVHYVHVPNNLLGKTIYAILALYYNAVKFRNKYQINCFIASDSTIGGLSCTLLKVFKGVNFIQEVQAEMTRISPLVVGRFRAFAFKKITLLVCGKALIVRAVSNKVKEQLIEDGVSQTKIRVVTSRVKLDRFHPKSYYTLSYDLRGKYFIDKKDKLFVFIGRLVVFKGLTYLIKALEKFNSVPYKLLIVGDGPLRDSLKAECYEHGIQDKVIFHGAVEYNEVPFFMSAADLIIMPSTDEGFPRVILEAMAMKKLIAASLVGGVIDIAKNEVNGYYFESQNPKAILETLNKIYADGDNGKHQKIIENAYQEVVKNYSFDAVMEKYNQLFKEYIEKING